MSNSKGNWFGNSNIKGYLFFLLFTTIVAIFIKLANTYNTSAEFQMVLRDIPKSLLLESELGDTCVVSYESSGFGLVRNSFRESVINIPYNALSKDASGVYVLKAADLKEIVVDRLKISPRELQIVPERLSFTVDSLASKVVPVVLRSDIEYEVGYGGVDTLVLSPSNVKLIGKKARLDSIQAIYTERLVRNNVSENIQVEVLVDGSTLPNDIVVTPGVIDVRQTVEKFTEGSVTIPISLENDSARDFQLFPKEVTLYYTIPISEFDTVTASDFRVSAVLSKSPEAENYLSLRVSKKPAAVLQTRLSLNKVQYIIVDE